MFKQIYLSSKNRVYFFFFKHPVTALQTPLHPCTRAGASSDHGWEKNAVKLPTDDDEEASSAKGGYKRYALASHKTFGSLFFPEKERLLGLLDAFQAGRGRFAPSGQEADGRTAT